MMRVLLTGSRAPVALELARRIHAHGDEVLLCDNLNFGCANFSRCRTRSFSTPRPNAIPSEYIAAINKIVKSESVDLILPTCEEVFYLAACRNQIDCEVLVDSFETLRDIHNKWTFSQIASNSIGSVPESFEISSQSELSEFQGRSDAFVFKPVYSRFASETLVQPGPERLSQLEISTKKRWLAQRLVHGKEYSTYSVARDGQLVAHCTYHCSFRAGIGSGICFRVEQNSSITEYTRCLVKELNFTGQIGIDCIVDDGGKIWVLEGNPRSTSGLHLFDKTPALMEVLLGTDHSFVEAQETSPRMVGVAMLSFGLKDAIAQRKLKRYFYDLYRSKDVLFRWSDPLPLLGLPLTMGELCWVAVRERKTLQQASTIDLEWNGEPI